jgi:hypothetical protein
MIRLVSGIIHFPDEAVPETCRSDVNVPLR